MSLKTLYPLTGTIMMIGMTATLYGIHSFSPIIFFEGVFLMWLGFSLTANIWEAQRLEG
jgi:hypothetical protein